MMDDEPGPMDDPEPLSAAERDSLQHATVDVILQLERLVPLLTTFTQRLREALPDLRSDEEER